MKVNYLNCLNALHPSLFNESDSMYITRIHLTNIKRALQLPVVFLFGYLFLISNRHNVNKTVLM